MGNFAMYIFPQLKKNTSTHTQPSLSIPGGLQDPPKLSRCASLI